MNEIQMILLLKLWVQFRNKITSSEKPFIISYRHRENKTFQINQSIVELPVIAAAKLLAEQYSILIRGSGCGSVGRAVASNSRGPRFESSHRK